MTLDYCKRIVGRDTVCTHVENRWKSLIHLHACEYVTDIYIKDIIPAEFDVKINHHSHGKYFINPGYDTHWTFEGNQYEGKSGSRYTIAHDCE